MPGKRKYLDNNQPYTGYYNAQDDITIPYASGFIPTYNLPEVSVVASSLPQAKATNVNIQRYTDAVANNQIKLSQIPNAGLRNRVRSKPIVDKIREDTDKAGKQIGLPLLGLAAAPMIASVVGPEVLGVVGNYGKKAMDAIAKPFSTVGKLPKLSANKHYARFAKIADSLYDMDLTYEGIKNFVTENGIKKTIRLTKEGDVLGALRSGSIDLLNLMGMFGLGKDIRHIKQTYRDIRKTLDAPERYRKLAYAYDNLRGDAYKKANTLSGGVYKRDYRLKQYEVKKQQIANELEKLVTNRDPNIYYQPYLGNPNEYVGKINFSKMTQQNKIKYGEKLKKEFGANNVSLDNNGNLHLSGVDLNNGSNTHIDIDFGKQGDYDIIDFSTGRHYTGNVYNMEGNGTVETVISSRTNPHKEGFMMSSSSGYNLTTPKTEGELPTVLSNNIKYVQNKIKGFKPFGSSVGTSEGAIHHVTHDIDGYMTYEDFMKYAEHNPVMKRPLGSAADNVRYDEMVAEWNKGVDGSANTYMTMMGDGKYGNQGNVDINVINIGKDGTANARTVEIYRQFFPEAYRKQVIEMGLNPQNSNTIRILDESGKPMSNKQLLDAVDPLKKTIMDSMEIDWNAPEKSKHAGRFIGYMLGDKPKAIHDALSSTSKLQFGKNARLLPKLSFGDITKNEAEILETLKDLGYKDNIAQAIINKAKQTNNPEYLQNAVDYWYITESKFQRSVGGGDFGELSGTPEKLQRNLTIWNPKAGGGTVFGAGLNTTRGKASQHPGIFNGLIQPYVLGLREGQNYKEALSNIMKKNFLKGNINSEEAKALQEIGLNVHEGEPYQSLLKEISHTDKKTFNDVISIIKTNGLSAGDIYGEGVFTGLRDLLPNVDAIGVNPGSGHSLGLVKGIPVLTDRMKALGVEPKYTVRVRSLIGRYPDVAMPYVRQIDDLTQLQENLKPAINKLKTLSRRYYDNSRIYSTKHYSMHYKADRADRAVHNMKESIGKLFTLNAFGIGAYEGAKMISNIIKSNKNNERKYNARRRRLDANGNKSK